MGSTKSGHEIRSEIIEKMLDKSRSLGQGFARKWSAFLKEDIYRAATPSGKTPGKKLPKKDYYKIGERYAVWSTYPTSCFDFMGELICIKTGWDAQHEYEGEAGRILGYRPWGIFKTEDGDTVYDYDHFVTTLEIKAAVEAAKDVFEVGSHMTVAHMEEKNGKNQQR